MRGYIALLMCIGNVTPHYRMVPRRANELVHDEGAIGRGGYSTKRSGFPSMWADQVVVSEVWPG